MKEIFILEDDEALRAGIIMSFRQDGYHFVPCGTAAEARSDSPFTLSRTEQRLLYFLTSNPGILLTRERMLEWVWPDGTEYVEDNALSVSIRRLRDKLEDSPAKPAYIKTVYGKGYMWVNPV